LARFFIKSVFKITLRNLFVVGGDVIAGTISKKMCHRSNERVWPINSIETISFNNKSLFAITFKYSNDADLKQLENIFEIEKEIELSND
jgi:hypothetical protein